MEIAKSLNGRISKLQAMTDKELELLNGFDTEMLAQVNICLCNQICFIIIIGLLQYTAGHNTLPLKASLIDFGLLVSSSCKLFRSSHHSTSPVGVFQNVVSFVEFFYSKSCQFRCLLATELPNLT